MKNTIQTEHYHVQEFLSADDIAQRVAQLGVDITKDYTDKELVAIGIMNGSWIFCADLVRKIDKRITVDFLQLSSYGAGTTSSGVVNITQTLKIDLNGKHIMIIEDIVDTSNSMKRLKDWIDEHYDVASFAICTLLNKPSRRQTHAIDDYIRYV